MYVSSRQGYKPPVKSTGRGKKYSHFASLKYCNGAETFYTVSYSPSGLMCKRESRMYDDESAWHNKFYKEVTSKVDEDIFTLHKQLVRQLVVRVS